MTDLADKRRARGDASDADIAQFSAWDREDLLALLGAEQATERSAAAILLRRFLSGAVIDSLCRQLTVEKSLYTKIEICKSLAQFGEPSVLPLIKLLGKIGNNQETTLQETGFYKKSYPLPRDIAARTLAQCGPVALPALENLLSSSEAIEALSEALDAYGHILYTGKISAPSASLQQLHQKYPEKDLLSYKIARCLSGFKTDWAACFLRGLLLSREPALRLQALRSLLLSGAEIPGAMRADFSPEMLKLEAALRQ